MLVHTAICFGSNQGRAYVISGTPLSLSASDHLGSVEFGWSQSLWLSVPSHPGANYLVLGSISGDSGLTLASVSMPLTLDLWTSLSYAFRNSAILTNTDGTLDGSGEATASFNFGGITGGDPGLVGFTFRHAALIFSANGCGAGCDVLHTATNNVKLTTTP